MTLTTITTQPQNPAPTKPVERVEPVTGTVPVTVGVDTHQRTHTAAVIDAGYRRLGHAQFPVTEAGYRELLNWARQHGRTVRFGVESTGSYGAGLTRYLIAMSHLSGGQDVVVLEVDRPEKTTRHKAGKSDPIDAYSAAEQALSGRAAGRPKATTGVVEAIRAIKVPRDAAVADRTRAFNQLRDLITTAPAPIHDELIALTGRQRVTRAAAMRPDPTRIAEPTHAVRHALRTLARRIQALDTEIAATDKLLTDLTRRAVPSLLAMRQVGVQTAAQLVITAGQNIDRIHSEAALAKLCGVAPLPASSGKSTRRHRLNRGGDRQANKALYMIAVGRMKNHPETRTYVEKLRATGKSNPEIIRCLKRGLIRRIHHALITDLMTT